MSSVDVEKSRRGPFLQAILLGLLFVLTLSAAAAVWYSQNRQCDVVALLSVGWQPPTPSPNRNVGRELEIIQRTQLAYLHSPYVLQTAIADPRVANSPILWQQTDPVQWLVENLQTSFVSDSEVLRVGLWVPKVDEADGAALLNAVVDAYLIETAVAETGGKLTESDREPPFSVRVIQTATALH